MEPIPAPAIDLISLAPVLVLSVFGIMVLILDLFIGKDKSVLAFISLIGLLMGAISSFAKYNLPVYSFNGAYVVDHLSVFFTIIFCISSSACGKCDTPLSQADVVPGSLHPLCN